MPSEAALPAVLQATTLDAVRAADPYDAIVVGAGATGGLAAALLAESGLRVLVLDAGVPRSRIRAPLRKVIGRVAGRLSAPDRLRFLPPALVPKARATAKLLGRWRQPIQSLCMSWEVSPNAFVDDRECPYETPPDHPFTWIRVRGLGGRVGIPGHGRQYYRLGSDDFNPSDGLSPAWPLHPNELDPWYASVEQRLDLSGMRNGLPWLPDSEITNNLSLTPAEAALRDKIAARWPGARAIAGRSAPPLESLEAAARTGRLSCRQGAVVREINVDGSGRVCGVSWIDHRTRSEQRSAAPLVFLCASALESTRILMLSRSSRNQQGLGASSGALGRYLMDHVLVSAEGIGGQSAHEPRSNRCLFIPRFDARGSVSPHPGRGFGVQVYEFAGAGGRSHFAAFSFGEMIPRKENRVTLDRDRTDAWGIPILRIDCAYSDLELAGARDQTQALRELAGLANVELTKIDETPVPPGGAYHECGSARMGTDPDNSVVDSNNECWDARGLYVTDGACFPSQGYQNPTLTMLALTARACRHALNGRQLLPEPETAERKSFVNS
ncbi:GMC family oxidoreductase [Bradyrhizobium sp. dw_78]|uniref:GMC oxidoreductase n=1 Tax=Bradyrhizobium sp. dw_78 TaxID=2719793 RepID=UPI001BD37DD6|nr:GMC family oxidoreductase [Bradyrhizobium sp. dw_78]